MKIPDIRQIPADHRRWHEASEIKDEQFFGRVADRSRVVDDQCVLATRSSK